MIFPSTKNAAARPRNPEGITPQISVRTVESGIEAALTLRARSQGHGVAIRVKGADVILTGRVHSWHERTLVRLSALHAPGVRNVVDMMTVKP